MLMLLPVPVLRLCCTVLSVWISGCGCVVYGWTVWHMDGLCGIWMDCVVYGWIVWYIDGLCGIWMDCVVYRWTVWYMDGLCGIWMDCVVWTCIYIYGLCTVCVNVSHSKRHFRHLPPNSVRIGYATEWSTAVHQYCQYPPSVWVLIRLEAT